MSVKFKPKVQVRARLGSLEVALPQTTVNFAHAKVVNQVGVSVLREHTPKVVLTRAIQPTIQPFPIELPGQNAPSVEPPPDVPDVSQGDGNLFPRQFGQDPVWHLPGFSLVEGLDTGFSFVASQSQQIDSETGGPFNTGAVSLMIQKTVPQDVSAWMAAHPDQALREIPLDMLEATILVQSISQGQTQTRSYPASVTQNSDGTFLVTANTILGSQVIALFQNLRATSSLKIQIHGSFKGWRIVPRPPAPPGTMFTMNLRFEVAAIPFECELPVGDKYAQGDYRQKYLVNSGMGPRVIVNVEDLRSFDLHQSEYSELLALGDVSQRYPSISRLYFGAISQMICVVPARYVILRDSGVCAAACDALVDSTAGVNAGCKFQFAFTLVPDVSSIDMILLTDELAGRPESELRKATLHLPRNFRIGANSGLPDPFLTTLHIAIGGSDPHSIALTADILERPDGTPAVANSNMFIAQLRSAREPFLSGTLGIHIDDVLQDPISTPILLNFANTQATSTAGLSLTIASDTNQALLQNNSSFDLRVMRVALLTAGATKVMPVDANVPAGSTLSLGILDPAANPTILIDSEIALGADIHKDDFLKLLQMRMIDVQNTQFLFGVNASGVNYAARGIAGIALDVALDTAPGVSIPTLNVSEARAADSARVVLPLQHALVEMQATVVVSVKFTDETKPLQRFTIPNDFGQHPIFMLSEDNMPQ